MSPRRVPVVVALLVAMLASLIGLVPPAGAATPAVVGGFSDVPDDHAFASEIAWLVDEGITTGYPDGTFRPMNPVSRQAIAAFLWRLTHDGAPTPTCASSPFTDVPADHPYCGEISWMAEAGVASGYDDGSFRPDLPVSRQAVSSFLFGVIAPAGLPELCTTAPFTDVPTNHGFCDAISWMKANGLANGYADGTFKPAKTVTRQDAAAFLYRLDATFHQTPALETTSLPGGTVGQPYATPLTATAGTTPYTFAAAPLPAGLTIDPTTGAITGTPLQPAGTTDVTVTVTDSLGYSDTVTLALAIVDGESPTITTSSLPIAMVGRAYTSTLAATGGGTPYEWSATGLPAGLTLDATTGAISGTPTTSDVATVAVTVTDNWGYTDEASLALTVTPELLITTSSLPTVEVGDTYDQTLLASGGASPYTWSASGLPAGLALDATTGAITGTPTRPGTTATVVVTVTDTNAFSTTESLTITVTDAPAPTITTASLPDAPIGEEYLTTLAVTGGSTPYTWAATNVPDGLSLNPATGAITGIPTVPGVSSVSITVTDLWGYSDSATLSLKVNSAPVASADLYSTGEDTALTVTAPGLLANDNDANSDPLTAVLATGPTHGTVTLSPDGSFLYTPDANFNGTDTFTYKTNDGTTDSSPATVLIIVTDVNDAPSATNDTATTDEDTPLTVTAPGVLINDTDVDGDPISAVLVTGPAHGTLSLNADGSFTYTPDANVNGTDTFTYKANDGTADSSTATVTITVTPVNDAPVATNDSYTTNEDTPLTVTAPGVLANDSDVDGDPLIADVILQPAHGDVTLDPNGSFVYTPDANFNGGDFFNYQARDNQGAFADIKTVIIDVTSVAEAPIATNDTFTTDEDTALTVTAPGVLSNDTDVDGDPISAVLVTGPAHGTLTLNADGAFTYTPDANVNGTDTFTYKANDGTADSSTATVTITVSSVNDLPTAVNDTIDPNTWEIASGNIFANDSDVESPSSALTVLNPNSWSTPQFTFIVTTSGDWSLEHLPCVCSGTITAPIQISDPDGGTAWETLEVRYGTTVGPAAFADSMTVAEGGTATTLTGGAPSVLTNDTDPQADTLNAVLVTGPAHGTLALNPNGTFSYTHDGSETTTDSFTYKANDGAHNSNTVTVTITVTPVNDAPVAVDDAFTTAEDQPLSWPLPLAQLTANDSDPDGDSVVLYLIGSGSVVNGSVDIVAGSLVFTPTANFNGTASFTYSIHDGNGGTATGTVHITVTPVNDSPVAVADTYAVDEDATLTVTAAGSLLNDDTDADADPLTAVLVTGPTNGSLTLNADGTFVYTPVANYSGSDTFTYRVFDGTATGNIATVAITVNPISDPPVGGADSYTVAPGGTLNVLAPGVLGNDGDPDGDLVSVISTFSTPLHGSLTLNPNGSFTYVHNGSASPSDSFVYVLADTDPTTPNVLVTVTITITTPI